MSQAMTSEEVAQKARDLLDARVEKIRTLTDSARRLEAAREAFDAASKSYTDAWAASEKAGWTVAELRQLGLSEPGKRRPGRPRKTSLATQRGEVGPGSGNAPV